MNKLPLAGVNFFEEPQFSRQSVILFFCFIQPQLGRTQQCQNRRVGGRGWKGEKSVPESVLFLLFLCLQHKKTDLYMMWLDG